MSEKVEYKTSGEELDREQVLAEMQEYLPEVGGANLAPNHFLHLIQGAKVLRWEEPQNAIFSYSFDGAYPAYNDRSFTIKLALAMARQPTDVFIRAIDETNSPRIHGELVYGHRGKPLRLRYGLHERDGVHTTVDPNTGEVLTNYFSINPARSWGDELDKGLVRRQLSDGTWWQALDEYPYGDVIKSANIQYNPHGISIRSTLEGGIVIDAVNRRQSIFSWLHLPHRSRDKESGVLLPRQIAFSQRTLGQT